MNAASNGSADTSIAASYRALQRVLESILSTRVSILDELQPQETGAHTRIHFRTLDERPIQFAVLPAAQFRRELEDEVRKAGYDGIAIRDPSDLEIAELTDFHLAPEWVRWTMPCPASADAWIESLPGSDARNRMRRKLRVGSSVRVATAPLSLSDYEAWHRELYVPEILSKRGAIPAWPHVAELSGKLQLPLPAQADSTIVPGMLRIFMFDESDRLIGGSLLSVDEADRMLRVRAAAYEAQSRAHRELAVAGMYAMIAAATQQGLAYLSYGDDPNLFGLDVTLGLARFKVSIGMRPMPAMVGRFQLIKIFDTTCALLGAEAGVRSGETNQSGLLCFGVPGRGAARLAPFRRLAGCLNSQLTYSMRAELAHANTAGLQFGCESTANAVRLPKGMTLARFDRPSKSR